MKEFPFPELLAFLESEKDQIEFMKIAAQLGITASDVEIGKLMLALQLYKAFYADIPRQIKAVHNAALNQVEGFRDDIASLADRTKEDAGKISQWAAQIQNAISAVQPAAVAEALHQKLLDEALASLGGSIQALGAGYSRLDVATKKLNAAAAQAEASLQEWQTVTLRRVWMCAFCTCSALTIVAGAVAWCIYSAH
jgi:ABC-type transporter Mla subunit MlaD